MRLGNRKRLEDLESKSGKGLVVLHMGIDDDKDQIVQRHLAEHPDDQGALIVCVRDFKREFRKP